ncbi:MAG: class I SAM-dependent methyltransferase [Terricaulis sp.]|nr:class I SAM-dependent methyltransferase [Terricaulis sp.]
MYRIARDNPDDCFVVNTFWTSTMDCEADGYMAQWGEFLRRAQAMPNLRIHALTPQLRVIIAKHTGVHLPLMGHPNPSMRRPFDHAAPPRAADAPFTVMFPGGMTEEKGFRDIPKILAAIRRNSTLDKARLVVRATNTAGVIDRARDPTARKIEALAETVDSVMDAEAFLDWLAGADVAVLPYRAQQWRYRNSALAIDLLYLGVPLVCCKGTWLADVLDQCGGGLAVDDDDAEAYAAAISAIRADLPRFKEAARRAAQRYHTSNSWPQLIDSVLAPAVAPRETPPAGEAEADRYAPIHWWPGAAPLAAPAYQPPADPEAPRASVARRFAGFAWFQLTRSRRVQALGLAGAALAAGALSGLAPLEPIRVHLGVLALAAFAAAGGAVVARFLLEYAEAVRARLAARSESIADIAASAGQALAANGPVKKFALGLVAGGGLLWLGFYGLRLADLASQSALDVAFWLGGGLSVLAAGGVLALQTAMHAGKRITARQRIAREIEEGDRTRALAAQIGADLRQALHGEIGKVNTALHDAARRERGLEISNLRLSRELEAVRTGVMQSARTLDAKLTEAAAASEALQAKLEQIEAQESALDGKLEVIALEQAKLRKRIALLQTAEKNRGEKLDALAATDAKIAKRVARIMASTDGLGEKLDAVTTQAVKKAKASDVLKQRMDNLQNEVRAVASGGYHGVERFIPKAELEALASLLAQSFNIAVSGRTLGYMTHQIRRLEADGEGRIATSMSDMLVRTAVLLAVERKQPALMEIGTLFGLGAAAMWAVARPQFERVTLTLIDPLDGYYGRDFVPNQEDIVTGVPVTRETLEHNLRKAGVPEEDVAVIQNLSQSPEALAEAAKHRYDVLIIDGDHTYEGAQRDFLNYAPFVRQGGFIIFDDYGGKAWQGVTDFVDDLMAETPNLEKVLLHSRTLVCRVIKPVAQAAPKLDGAQGAANGQAEAQAAAGAAPSRA